MVELNVFKVVLGVGWFMVELKGHKALVVICSTLFSYRIVIPR